MHYIDGFDTAVRCVTYYPEARICGCVGRRVLHADIMPRIGAKVKGFRVETLRRLKPAPRLSGPFSLARWLLREQ